MESLKPKILVSHPANNPYYVVLAFQKAALLQRFITGIYYKPHKSFYKVVDMFPVSLRQHTLKALERRRWKQLNDKLIVSMPYFDFLFRILAKFSFFRIPRRPDGSYSWLIYNRLFDYFASVYLYFAHPRPTIFYGFEGACLASIKTAKRLGITTVLDVPIVLGRAQMLELEKEQLGLGPPHQPVEFRSYKEVRLADYLITASEATAQSVIELGVKPDKVFIVPFGVDASKFQPAAFKQPNVSHKFKAIFVGQFIYRKGVHYLLEAWKQLNLPNSELTIVGPSDTDSPAFIELMRTRYAGIFVEVGSVNQSELAHLLTDADIFVFPSLLEGSARVVYEALASGLPCIVTPEAGSVVQDGVEGYIIPIQDVVVLKERIRMLYDNPELRRRMGRAARLRAEEFTWERYEDELARIMFQVQPDNLNKQQS